MRKSKKTKVVGFALSAALLTSGVASFVAPVGADASEFHKTAYSNQSHNQYKNSNGKGKEQQAVSDSIFERGVLAEFKSEYAQVEGNNIHYKIYSGSKKPSKTYVVAHGATATLETTKVYASALVKEDPKARIILVDLPLHGKSTSDSFTVNDISVKAYAEIMKSFIEQKRADNTIQGTLNWSGWSMGGSIGLQLDLLGANIDELVLLNSSPVWATIEGIATSFGLTEYPDGLMEQLMEQNYVNEMAFGNISEGDSASILSQLDKLTSNSDVAAKDFNMLFPQHYDLREELSEIKAKTLIIGGTFDALATVGNQELMNQEIAGSKLVIYEDGHSQFMKPQIASQIANEVDSFFGDSKKGKGHDKDKGKK